MNNITMIPSIELYGDKHAERLGERIREARERKGYSLLDIGLAMNYNGAGPASKLELGSVKCTAKHLFELSQILEVSTDYLLGLSGNSSAVGAGRVLSDLDLQLKQEEEASIIIDKIEDLLTGLDCFTLTCIQQVITVMLKL